VPAISRAGRIRLEGLSVDIRILHGKAAHHFVVLVVKDMAMVDITWELAKLVTGNVEEVACLSVLLSETGFGPSNTILKSFERHNPGSIFPSGIVRILRRMTFFLENVFVSSSPATCIDSSVLQILFILESDHSEQIEPTLPIRGNFILLVNNGKSISHLFQLSNRIFILTNICIIYTATSIVSIIE
jgi:hypothetical protein